VLSDLREAVQLVNSIYVFACDFFEVESFGLEIHEFRNLFSFFEFTAQ